MTIGGGVKPTFTPFEGKGFHDDAAAAAPRGTCAAAAHPLGQVPPSGSQPRLSGIGGCVCGTPLPPSLPNRERAV